MKNNLPVLSTIDLPTVPEGNSLTTLGGLTTSQIDYAISSHFVAEPCPPIAARNDEILVYRLVSNNPPTKDDFLPSYIEHPHQSFPPEEVCDSRGVSVFNNETVADKTRKRYKGLKGKSIAYGMIYEEDGRVLETRSQHHMTWWLETEVPHRNLKLGAK